MGGENAGVSTMETHGGAMVRSCRYIWSAAGAADCCRTKRRACVSPALPWLLGLALGFAALQLAAAWVGPYELFHDELYYWAGAKRLGLGYVDHPPFAPWLLAGARRSSATGASASRLVPALCARRRCCSRG